ncbi:hypothetical protein PM1_023 [Pectobacterium phage PM1]|uniref:Uncharacterized protein n=1 Tax=Pectobacterium phage PM1 TaxID=1399915 RepID=X2CT45_9CAUD|nr:hypothetical protein PM1_023 [Pectobacterium phage PM1]AGV99239.1 hypothetical protein PM1_023 [Pectobacterium phage PM1]
MSNMIPVSGKDLGTMRDELAKIVFSSAVVGIKEVFHCPHSKERLDNLAVGIAKVSYKFADAMMEARMVQPTSVGVDVPQSVLAEAFNKG